MESNLDKRYQTMVVLWFSLLMNIGVFFLVSMFVAPRFRKETGNPPGSLFTITLTALGALLVIVSFAVKGKLLERSIERQDVTLVQKAIVVACAMCEVSAVLGLLERLILWRPEYYVLFLFAAAGTALHFPRRSHLEAATYKSRNTLN